VLFLTARDGVSDRVRGLELGGDDYLVKPFAFVELLARVRTLARRGPPRESDLITVSDLEIDVTRRKVRRAGKRIELTPREFALLQLLARKKGEENEPHADCLVRVGHEFRRRHETYFKLALAHL
jgi:two-component system copper resistance phosphate regulon response regulator CusR